MPKPALFLHIQKTAGTSIQQAARWVYGNGGVASHADFHKLGMEKLRSIPFVSGHFGFEFARQLREGRYFFTFLRNPIERLISLYAFCLTRDPKENALYAAAQKAADLEGFLRSYAKNDKTAVWNNQVWQLAYGVGAFLVHGDKVRTVDDFTPDELLELAKENLAAFDHVGMVETFDVDEYVIRANLEWGREHVTGKVNVTKKPSLDELPGTTRRLLLDLTELDQELYNYQWGRNRDVLARMNEEYVPSGD